jgi:hypothetical protein
MKQIIYLDQTQLSNPGLAATVETLGQVDSTMPNYTVRAGKNVLPFNSAIVDQLDLGMPAFDKNFNCGLNDITDQRCHELLQTHADKPWLIFWSGGIDSTAVLVSILKNVPLSERSRIQVACNKISVYENVRFYYDYIVPNFATVDSTFLSLSEKLLTDYYVLTGEFADQLFYNNKITDPDRDLFQDPDQLLTCIPEQVYQQMIANIQSVDIPVQTYRDFFWWFSFNLQWTGAKIQPVIKSVSNGPEFIKLYLKNYVGWFETDAYQQWAMQNYCIGKLELKQYIHEFNHDDYYFTFKTKGTSLGRMPDRSNWFCMLDDFTTLSLDNDLEQIQELLPTYVV